MIKDLMAFRDRAFREGAAMDAHVLDRAIKTIATLRFELRAALEDAGYRQTDIDAWPGIHEGPPDQ